MSLTWDDKHRARDRDPDDQVDRAACSSSAARRSLSEDNNWNTSVIGTDAVWFKIRNWDAAEGVVFDEDTGNSNAKIAMIGQDRRDPAVRQTRRRSVRPSASTGQPYEVVGVLATKGQGPMGDNDDTIDHPGQDVPAEAVQGPRQVHLAAQLLVSMHAEGSGRADDREDHVAAARSPQARRRRRGRLPHPQPRRVREGAAGLDRAHRDAARDRRRGVAVRRRHRRHEHHARQRDRANPRDRHPHGRRREADRRDDAVPRRGARARRGRRRARPRCSATAPRSTWPTTSAGSSSSRRTTAAHRVRRRGRRRRRCSVCIRRSAPRSSIRSLP